MTSNPFLNQIKTNIKNPVKGVGSERYCPEFYKAIGNIKKARIYVYGAGSKTGKTTLVDYLHILVPYIEGYKDMKFYYFGWEISIEEKQAAFCAFFMSYKHGIAMDADRVQGLVGTITEEEEKYISDIYNNELVEIFGVYDDEGSLETPGMITYIETPMNAAEMETFLRKEMIQYGEFKTSKRGLDYFVWHDITKHVHVIVDHIGKTPKRGKDEKKTAIDNISGLFVTYRNLCRLSFIIISQFNRSLSAVERRDLMSSNIRPEKTDFKDTSNLAEDCNYLFGLLNPLLLAELDSIKIGGTDYKLRKRDQIIPGVEGFRGFYLLESRHNCPTFEKGFVLKNNYIELK